MKLLKKGVPRQNTNAVHDKTGRDIYLFVPEDGVFLTYIADMTGARWRKVVRWAITGFENFDENGPADLFLRPFSTSHVNKQRGEELRYMLTNILYSRKPLGKAGVFRVLCEPFDRESNGALNILNHDIPVESMLFQTFVLTGNLDVRSVSPLNKDGIEKIVSAISERNGSIDKKQKR